MKTLDETTLLGWTDSELDKLFRASPPGEVPRGPTDGTALLAAGTGLTRTIAAAARRFAWRGKVFEPDGRRLRNRITPFDLTAIAATVSPGESWVDRKPCIVIDYSRSSLVARGVRDEIRLIAPGLYLGVVWLWRQRAGWFLLRKPPGGQILTGPSPNQVALTIRAPLAAGRAGDVPGLLDELRKSVELDGGPFRDLSGVHFARMFPLPPETAGDGNAPTLVYMAELDAPVRAHLRELAAVRADALSSLFGLCEGYPDTGTLEERVRWLGRHRIDPAATYVHRVGRGLSQIREEARLRERIEDFLDDPGQDWSGATGVELHRAIRGFVAAHRDLSWALRPQPRPGLAFRTRETVHRLVLPAAVPVLLPALPLWAVLIRRLEQRDEPERVRVGRDRLEALTRQEDVLTQNPFTATGFVKPGLVRRATLRTVLTGLDYFNRHVYATDNLAGVRTIHFARWVYIDQGRRLIFASNYDGSLESYMDDFIDKLAPGLNAVFSNGVGYPATRWLLWGGARDEQAFKSYLRSHQLPSVWYSAYGDLSARNIDDNTRIRDGLTRDLDPREARSWLALL
ncbi:hypothetical protein HFP15_00240 [Amycolatopsis sp. K13G38]|uniref:Uncharacterized protein n=1 Tax=Amycolatopsis acididurans TaxID=2724524 RepID=A0ABX1IUZ2_9PSEU|nr:hypothetical protein [Amycolatopsis acididurans]NKQ51308.1 hypothetical protein [Amycolatopsis acididurans]